MDGFVYQFGIGGLVFAVGLAYAARQGYVGLGGVRLRNLAVVLAAAVYFLAVQAYLQYASMETAPELPYRGGADHLLGVGQRARGAWIDYVIMIGYFVAIVLIGTWYGRRQRTTRDFFFGGQRFAWWLIAFSLVATTIGSYSFVKYGRVAYAYGLSSSQTYLNDWIWLPLALFGWIPILYFSRITSIPEYFGRRFGPHVRLWATIFVLVYLVGYIGVNLFTMGKVLNLLIGWPIPLSALLVAVISASYVTAGGQTSVIMTDLFQGVMLLVTGLVLLFLGIDYLGGLDAFWEHLPRGHRQAFSAFNATADFPAVGIFWQDAIANSAMFYFLNQGILMRLVAARSVQDSRKALIATVVVLMTVAACVVASGGWVARALVHAGVLPPGLKADQAFFVASEFLARPGVFGLVLAALTAALMSTLDTLITAVAAVAVNDLYQPYVRPDARDEQLLRAARWTSLGVTGLGVLLVPVFMNFQSIYAAHGAFTAAVTPPLVVALLFSVFWRRYTRAAALWTLVGGMAAVGLSLVVPEVIAPFAHGVPTVEAGDGLLDGMRQHKFMRALFGLSISAAIGVVVTLFTRPEPEERQRGLVWGTVADALRRYKGGPGDESASRAAPAFPRVARDEAPLRGEARLPVVRLSPPLAAALEAKPGDLVYVSDRRWWKGGLHSAHAVVGAVDLDDDQPAVELGPKTWDLVVVRGREAAPLRVQRLY